MASTEQLARQYIDDWKGKGYDGDIPDTVPHELMKRGLAPSYQALALAILNNDLRLTSLGFQAPKSDWYNIIKKIEIKKREQTMTPDAKVKERIEQLRSQQVPWPDVAQTLQSEGLPSRSGKPWSPFMAMNYIKTNAQSKPVHPSPAKNDEIDTNYSVKSDLEIRIEVLEKRLMLEIHRGIELEAKLAAVNA